VHLIRWTHVPALSADHESMCCWQIVPQFERMEAFRGSNRIIYPVGCRLRSNYRRASSTYQGWQDTIYFPILMQRVLLPNGQTDGHGLWLMGCQEVSSHGERTLPLRNLVTDASAMENWCGKVQANNAKHIEPEKKRYVLTIPAISYGRTSTSIYFLHFQRFSSPAFRLNSAQ
jgi:hypothetical protein